jgi:type I restriction enzyme S subunit
MNADRLLAHFERISEAPDAIARLRRFILDLAVRGKLVEQDPEDEPAEELLAQIAGSGLEMDDLPSAWCRAELGSVLVFQYGKGLAASERLDCGSVPVYGSNGIVGYTDRPLFRDSSIIVGRKGSAGALNLCQGPSWVTDVSYYVAAPAFFSLEYLLVALAALDLDALGKGVKPGLSRSDAYAQLISIPPLAEQHRIVAKVDELMALCDQLEAARHKREQGLERLMAATLQRLNQPAEDPASFRQDTSFALQVLPTLTTTPAQIKQLRQTILNLAVRGKLVEQDPEDEPAEVLLSKISQDLAAFTLQRRSRSEVKSVLTPGERPFTLPPEWRWVRLDELFRVITDGDHQPPPKASEGVSFLTIGNISGGTIDFKGCRFVSNEYFDSLDEIRTPEHGDILYTVVGATYGRPVIVTTMRPFCVQRHIAILKPSRLMNSGYLLQLLSSPFIYSQATSSLTGTAQPTVALRPLRSFLAPLPPLAEQHRIVAKVDELMALCDQLEQQLSQADHQRRRLLEAVLVEVLLGPEKTLEAAYA